MALNARSTPATTLKQHSRSNWQLCCLLLRVAIFGNNVKAKFDFVEATFDFVAFDNVAGVDGNLYMTLIS